MIAAVRTWLTSVVTVTLLLSVAQTLVPAGTFRRLVSLVGGALLLVTLLRPLLGTQLQRLHWEDYLAAISQQQAELETMERQELSALIEEKTAAYISDKAASLGLSVTAQVQTEASGTEGTPIPWSAELTGPYSQTLAAYVEETLGIPQERQVWHEVEQ